MSESCQASGWVSDSHIILKIAKRRARNVVSPACNILLVMPDGPGDLSSFNFLSISVSSSFSVIGAVKMEGVVGVVVEAAAVTLWWLALICCATASSYGDAGCRKRWWPSANLKKCQLRGLRVASPFRQIRLSGESLLHVFGGRVEVA